MIEVFSSGGGSQSICMKVLILEGKLPKPDFIAIVDTERERSTTWEYLDSVVRPAFKDIGVEIHRVRRSEWGSIPAHGNDWMSHNGNTMILPAFTSRTEGESGKLPGFCSKTWKGQVLDRYLSKKFGIKRKQYRKWIGFSLDESRRALRMMAGLEYKQGLIRFPLIHDVPLRRQAAIKRVEAFGWPTPPRSACWMCPNQQDEEWQSLTPEEFAQAVLLEKEIQKIDPHAWFHNSCVPLDQVDFSKPPELDFERACSSGGCFI